MTAVSAWRKKPVQRNVKRLIDVVAAAIGLLVSGPVLVGLMCLVRFRLGSPALFVQLRPGLGGRPFRMV